MSSPRGDGPVGRQTGRVVSRSRAVTAVSYGAFLADRTAPRVAWASPAGLELAGAGAAARVTASGSDRFETVRRAATARLADVDHDGPPATRPRFVGGVAFEPDHDPEPPWAGLPAASFVLPAVTLTSSGGETWLTVVESGPDPDPAAVEARLDRLAARLAELPAMQPAGGPPGVRHTERTPDREGWEHGVRTVLEAIAAGRLRKVALAQRLEATLAGELAVPDVLERVRRRYPDCFRFLVEPTSEAAFFGAPPERLVRRSGDHVETEALAGSVERGTTPEADAELARRLREDEKLRVEQALVAETIEAALDRLGTVAVGDREVRRLSNIQHLRTPVEATLDRDTHVLELVDALHPTPAVGGLPSATARETIREVEPFRRGWYAAPVGWFDAAGDGEFAVGIRSAVAGGGNVTLHAGNGIVADSDPAEEWAELAPKYRPILDELR